MDTLTNVREGKAQEQIHAWKETWYIIEVALQINQQEKTLRSSLAAGRVVIHMGKGKYVLILPHSNNLLLCRLKT